MSAEIPAPPLRTRRWICVFISAQAYTDDCVSTTFSPRCSRKRDRSWSSLKIAVLLIPGPSHGEGRQGHLTGLCMA